MWCDFVACRVFDFGKASSKDEKKNVDNDFDFGKASSKDASKKKFDVKNWSQTWEVFRKVRQIQKKKTL